MDFGQFGPNWGGRELSSTAPAQSNREIGILICNPADPADPAETVAAASGQAPLPHAPGARMTVVTKLPQTKLRQMSLYFVAGDINPDQTPPGPLPIPTLPSTRAGGQDDGSLNKLPQTSSLGASTRSTPRTAMNLIAY